MTGLDPLGVLSLVFGGAFGGSGIAAWYLTYLQIKNEQRKQAMGYFRELVLTEDFRRYLTLLFSMYAASSDETENGLKEAFNERK